MGRHVELPIFPLSNVVLFPRLQTPLHLFEARYRQMAELSLAAEGQIGMVVVPPEHVDEMPGDPPVYPIGCAGVISQSQRLPDGRFNIVLAGMQRFRIVRELEPEGDRLYRVAEVELLDDPFPPEAGDRVSTLRSRIVELVRTLVGRSDPERADQITPELFDGVDDVTFVNSLCNAFSFEPVEKQGLLEADSIPTRFDRLEGLLSYRLAEMATPGDGGSTTLH
ncbi:MAG: LON peptidase substrate-binding domain-containing protein [Myxococcota bacterium]|nr:LON peptidase substrate-binding domain-containing protein [Myxococcota bacterium]